MGKWKMVRLGDVAKINMGQSPASETYNDIGKGLPFFQGKTDFQSMYPTIRMFCSAPQKTANKNDILMSVRAPVGVVNIATQNCCIGRGLAAISETENVSYYRYLFYYLRYKENDIANMGVGSTFKAISRKDINMFSIPLPPLAVQQKIADALDKASALIELRKAQLEKLDLLIKSQFIEMFGDPATNPMQWGVRHLGEICSVGSSKRVFVEELVEQGIPFYRGTEIGALSIGESVIPTLYITEEHYNNLKNKTGVPIVGDLLMPSICPDGRIWRVNTNKPFYFKDGRVLWVHPQIPDIDSIFLQFALRNKLITDYHDFASGTTFSELKIFSLKNVPIIMPPINLQKQFSAFVQQSNKVKLELQRSLEKLELNYKSLMQKCFRGEIF